MFMVNCVRLGSGDGMKIRAGIEVSGQSDIGCLRKNNEDSFGYWEPEEDGEFAAQRPSGGCSGRHGRIRRRAGGEPHGGRHAVEKYVGL